MTPNSNNFRVFAYLGAGGVFIGLLAFIFLAFPHTKRWKLPTETSSTETQQSPFRTGSGDQRRGGGKRISEPSESSELERANDPSLPGEVIIRANSREELAKLFTRALEAGGQYKDLIPELLAARLQFPTREAADKFRDSLGDGDISDQNYIVMAPDFPDTQGGAPRTPNPGDGNQNTSTETLKPFGDRALEFLGVTEDNSEWGKGVTIAILDSGVYAHESLTGINIKQIDLVQTEENPDADYTGHGTAVADIAHLVAPSADILSVRVLDSDGIGDTFTVAQGIVAAADNGANIINLSLGSYGDSVVLRDAIDYANERGTSIVAATGNDGIEQVSYPAAYEKVIGVSAIDASGEFAGFSNYGDSVDIGAPGVGINTAWEQDGEVSFSGTSAASPFVAGAIAATITRNQGYTVGQAADKVQQSALDAGAAGEDPQTGNGILQLGE